LPCKYCLHSFVKDSPFIYDNQKSFSLINLLICFELAELLLVNSLFWFSFVYSPKLLLSVWKLHEKMAKQQWKWAKRSKYRSWLLRNCERKRVFLQLFRSERDASLIAGNKKRNTKTDLWCIFQLVAIVILGRRGTVIQYLFFAHLFKNRISPSVKWF